MILQSTLEFLKELRRNNYRDWFHAHKAEYETARNNVLETAGELQQGLNEFDSSVGHHDIRKCMFRIARDTRFSPDKTPYKSHVGVIFNGNGTTKSPMGGYYLHVSPGDSFVSCGFYMPEPFLLKAVRKAIDDEWETFSAIVHDKKFTTEFGRMPEILTDETKILKRVPAGFNMDSPAAEYLKITSFYVYKSFNDKELTSPGFVKEALRLFRMMKPLQDFLKRAAEHA